MLNDSFKMDLVHGGDVLLYGTALGDSVWLAWCGGAGVRARHSYAAG